MKVFTQPLSLAVVYVAILCVGTRPSAGNEKGLGSKLYWTDGGGIHRANLDGSDIENALIQADNRRPGSLVLDRSARKIYWVDRDWIIYRSDLNGGNLEAFAVLPSFHLPLQVITMAIDPLRNRICLSCHFPSDAPLGGIYCMNLTIPLETELGLGPGYLGSIGYLALDPQRRKMYFLDNSDLLVANLDDPFFEPVRTEDLDYLEWPWDAGPDSLSLAPKPFQKSRSFALDYENDTIYFAIRDDYTSESGVLVEAGLYKADLDGSNPQMISQLILQGKLQVEKAKLYWKVYRGEIFQINLDGSDVQQVTDGAMVIDFEVFESKVYWTDSKARVRRSNVDSSAVQDLFAPPRRHIGLFAIEQSAGKIYWTDALSGSVQSVNLDGSGWEILVSGSDWPTRIVATSDRLYWVEDVRPPILKT